MNISSKAKYGIGALVNGVLIFYLQAHSSAIWDFFMKVFGVGIFEAMAMTPALGLFLVVVELCLIVKAIF